jgi:uncharacterized membrane protein
MKRRQEVRPVLQIPLTTTDKVVNVFGFLCLAAQVLIPLAAWADLPDQVPAHFGPTGEVDRWNGRGMVWALPVVGALLWGGLLLISKIPHTFNYPWVITEENAPDLYRLSRSMLLWINTECALMFAVIQYAIVRTALGHDEGWMKLFIPVVLITIFPTMGYFLYRSSKVARINS